MAAIDPTLPAEQHRHNQPFPRPARTPENMSPFTDRFEADSSDRSERSVSGYLSPRPNPSSGHMTTSGDGVERPASARSERTVSGYEPNGLNHTNSGPQNHPSSPVTPPRGPDSNATSLPPARDNEEPPDRSLRSVCSFSRFT